MRAITRTKDLAEKKEAWNGLLFRSPQNSPFLTHEWINTWWACFGQDAALRILAFRNEDGLKGLAPLMVKDGTLQFTAGREVTDVCDFICEEGLQRKFAESFYDFLAEHSEEFNTVKLTNIPASSSIPALLSRIAPEYGFSYFYKETEVTPVIHLPTCFDEYMNHLDRKKRHEIRRKAKKTESLSGLKMRRITQPPELRDHMSQFMALHRQGSPQKADFWKKEGMPEFFMTLTDRFSQMKWVELFALFRKDQMLSALLNFIYAGRLYFYNSAFDRNYSDYSPGSYLFYRRLKDAVAEGLETADFLRGGEKYKYDFGAQEAKIGSVTLQRKA